MGAAATASTTWVLESGVFPDSRDAMRSAVQSSGADVIEWQDAWWSSRTWPRLDGRVVIFHGSLGNADRVRREVSWRPGAYCDTSAFRCSAWYARAERWLLHRTWRATTVRALVDDPARELASLGAAPRVFVRPDSPLKPFSGRVLPRERLTLSALDHGFYYDDDSLPVIVAPVREVGREWRYVVVGSEVVAGSAYDPDRRGSRPDERTGNAWRFADDVARSIEAPEPVYVLDVCEADGDLHLLELNPFGGADLYSCDRSTVVATVSAWARSRV